MLNSNAQSRVNSKANTSVTQNATRRPVIEKALRRKQSHAIINSVPSSSCTRTGLGRGRAAVEILRELVGIVECLDARVQLIHLTLREEMRERCNLHSVRCGLARLATTARPGSAPKGRSNGAASALPSRYSQPKSLTNACTFSLLLTNRQDVSRIHFPLRLPHFQAAVLYLLLEPERLSCKVANLAKPRSLTYSQGCSRVCPQPRQNPQAEIFHYGLMSERCSCGLDQAIVLGVAGRQNH